MIARLPPARVAVDLKRLRLNEWAFIRECSRADRCSVSVCPFDPLVESRTSDPRDRETKCPASKPDRERFFSRMDLEMQALLPFGGLLESEWNRREAGRRRQASLTPEQRAKQLATLESHRAPHFGAVTSSAKKSTEAETSPNTFPPESRAKVGGSDA